MKRNGSLHARLAMLCGAILLASLALGCASSDAPTSAGGDTGSLDVRLELANGAEIIRVEWVITRPGMDPMSGDAINTSAPGATASIEVYGLEEGDGYQIDMTAESTDEETTCRGDAPFSITAGQATAIDVMLNCKRPSTLGSLRANGELNICAELAKVIVSPLETSVNNEIDLSATGIDVDNDEIEYRWTVTGGGEIADDTSAETTFTCTSVSNPQITISVSDDGFDHCNEAEWAVPVTCVGNERGFDFTVIDIPGGSQESAKGVNNLGEIVGDYRPDDTVQLPDGTDRFDIWVSQPNGTIDTFTLPTGLTAQVSSINDLGQVAGLSVLDEFAEEVISFGWVYDINTGEYRQYDYAPPGNEDAPDCAITEVTNDGQTIVGWYDTSVNEFQYLGLVDSIDGGNLMTIDGPAERFTFVWGTNDSGLLVGRESRSGFVSTDGIRFDLFQVDGNFTTALDVNNAGTVVGSYFSPGFESELGFILNQGELTSGISAAPDAVRTAIEGINDEGLFVGEFTDAGGDRHAFYSVFPPDSDSTIVFVSERTGDDELYAMNGDGTEVERLTDSPGPDRAPTWDFPGEQLVFNSQRAPHEDQPELYRLDFATREITRITDDPLEDLRGTWTPDESAVVFQRGTFFTGFGLWQHELATGNEELVISFPDSFSAAPSVSPDGGALVFQSNHESTGIFPFRLYTLDLATSEVESFFHAPSGSDDGPRWSPDGTRIAFSSSRGDSSSLYVAVLETGQLEQVTDDGGWDISPAWSPDGNRLVFQSDRVLEDGGIHVVDLRSGELSYLGEGRTPVWSSLDRSDDGG